MCRGISGCETGWWRNRGEFPTSVYRSAVVYGCLWYQRFSGLVSGHRYAEFDGVSHELNDDCHDLVGTLGNQIGQLTELKSYDFGGRGTKSAKLT